MDIIDTSFEVEYDLVDTTAAQDATVVCSNNASFADASLLNVGTEFGKYMTLEHNFSVLDGSLLEFPTSPQVAIFSDSMSDENGEFVSNPTIDITFTRNHSSVGLTLNFIEDYPLECIIYWYNADDDLLTKKRFELDKLEKELFNPVKNYRHIKIEFTKTIPYRYVKVNSIIYGIEFKFTEKEIISAKLNEEMDMVSDKISVNTLEFSIYDALDDFNLGNADGLHAYIQSRQVIYAYENVRGERIFLGKFFVNKFSSDKGLIKFTNTSALGLTDNDFYKGDVYNGTPAGDVFDIILPQCGITDYEIDSEVLNTPIYGALKPMSGRKALRELLFVTQSVIDTSRQNGVKIYRKEKAIKDKIGRDIKISTKVTKQDYVSGISVNYNTYKIKAASSQITKGIYPVGDNLITFKAPYTNITATSGTIIESGKFYCILRMTTQEEVTLSGIGYDVVKSSASANVAEIEGGSSENIKTFTSELANYELALDLANALLKYYSYNLKIEIQYLARGEQINSWTIIENPDSRYDDYVGTFESIVTDLTGGFVSTAKLVGYYNLSNYYYRTGNELITNDNFII